MQGLLVLLIGQAIAVMDGSIMAVAAPTLRIDLHASGGELQLIVSMYALAFASLVVTGARLGATVGHRRAFIWGLAAFTVASLIGGLAPNPPVLVVARVLQGAAAALMTPQVLSIIQLQYAGERRARAIGAYSMILAVGVATGMLAVLLIMACYSGFLISLTLYLQGALGFSPLHAGATFAIYASGFATASLTWTRAGAPYRDRLPMLGPVVLGAALLALGQTTTHGHWQTWLIAPLLFTGGVGHAWGFSPLATRLTAAVNPSAAADMSGFILTASLIGQVMGVATFTGIYLSQSGHHPQSALAITTEVIAAVSIITAACGKVAAARRRAVPVSASA